VRHYDKGIRKNKQGKLSYRCHFNRPTKEALPINVNGVGRIAPLLPKDTGWTATFEEAPVARLFAILLYTVYV